MLTGIINLFLLAGSGFAMCLVARGGYVAIKYLLAREGLRRTIARLMYDDDSSSYRVPSRGVQL
jgi:hypothetical protein